jgi:hypothetical protein
MIKRDKVAIFDSNKKERACNEQKTKRSKQNATGNKTHTHTQTHTGYSLFSFFFLWCNFCMRLFILSLSLGPVHVFLHYLQGHCLLYVCMSPSLSLISYFFNFSLSFSYPIPHYLFLLDEGLKLFLSHILYPKSTPPPTPPPTTSDNPRPPPSASWSHR